ncbi:hypothetical protein P9112_014207 [Eukaryota sp. TZLM1-RC]
MSSSDELTAQDTYVRRTGATPVSIADTRYTSQDKAINFNHQPGSSQNSNHVTDQLLVLESDSDNETMSNPYHLAQQHPCNQIEDSVQEQKANNPNEVRIHNHPISIDSVSHTISRNHFPDDSITSMSLEPHHNLCKCQNFLEPSPEIVASLVYWLLSGRPAILDDYCLAKELSFPPTMMALKRLSVAINNPPNTKSVVVPEVNQSEGSYSQSVIHLICYLVMSHLHNTSVQKTTVTSDSDDSTDDDHYNMQEKMQEEKGEIQDDDVEQSNSVPRFPSPHVQHSPQSESNEPVSHGSRAKSSMSIDEDEYDCSISDQPTSSPLLCNVPRLALDNVNRQRFLPSDDSSADDDHEDNYASKAVVYNEQHIRDEEVSRNEEGQNEHSVGQTYEDSYVLPSQVSPCSQSNRAESQEEDQVDDSFIVEDGISNLSLNRSQEEEVSCDSRSFHNPLPDPELPTSSQSYRGDDDFNHHEEESVDQHRQTHPSPPLTHAQLLALRRERLEGGKETEESSSPRVNKTIVQETDAVVELFDDEEHELPKLQSNNSSEAQLESPLKGDDVLGGLENDEDSEPVQNPLNSDYLNSSRDIVKSDEDEVEGAHYVEQQQEESEVSDRVGVAENGFNHLRTGNFPTAADYAQNIMILREMGFEPSLALEALRSCANNLDLAVAYIVGEFGAVEQSAPSPPLNPFDQSGSVQGDRFMVSDSSSDHNVFNNHEDTRFGHSSFNFGSSTDSVPSSNVQSVPAWKQPEPIHHESAINSDVRQHSDIPPRVPSPHDVLRGSRYEISERQLREGIEGRYPRSTAVNPIPTTFEERLAQMRNSRISNRNRDSNVDSHRNRNHDQLFSEQRPSQPAREASSSSRRPRRMGSYNRTPSDFHRAATRDHFASSPDRSSASHNADFRSVPDSQSIASRTRSNVFSNQSRLGVHERLYRSHTQASRPLQQNRGPFVPNEAHFTKLMSMGFIENDIEIALRRTNNNLERALELLLAGFSLNV